MDETLHVGVTIDTRKHGAVHRMREFAGINEKAMGFAVYVLTQRGVAMARKTVIILQLVLALK